MTKILFAAAALLMLSLLAPGQNTDKSKVSGKWHFVLHTEGGDRENDSTLAVAADKVSGKWNVETNDPSPITGTFIDGQLLMEVALTSSEIGPGTMKIKAHVGDDGTITGDWAFQDYTGTLSAKRTADPAK